MITKTSEWIYKYSEIELTAWGFGAHIFPFRGNCSQFRYLRQLLSHKRGRCRLNWKCSSLFKSICSMHTNYTIIDVWCFGKVNYTLDLLYKIYMKRTLFINSLEKQFWKDIVYSSVLQFPCMLCKFSPLSAVLRKHQGDCASVSLSGLSTAPQGSQRKAGFSAFRPHWWILLSIYAGFYGWFSHFSTIQACFHVHLEGKEAGQACDSCNHGLESPVQRLWSNPMRKSFLTEMLPGDGETATALQREHYSSPDFSILDPARER